MRLLLIATAAFILGAWVGSIFLGFLERRASGRPLWGGQYSCAVCGNDLRIRDRIPVVSYLRTGGHCRYCGVKYPMAELLCELACGGAFLAAVIMALLSLRDGDIPCAVAKAVVMVLLGLGAVNDIYCHECEYFIQYGIVVVAVAYAFFFAPISNIIAMNAMILFLYVSNRLYRKVHGIDSGMGMGDIIVASGCSGVIHTMVVPLMLLVACMAGILAAPLAKKVQKEQGTEEDEPGFGLLPFIVLGMLVADGFFYILRDVLIQ